MPDREKVIKGLECHRIDNNRRINCADCPYYVDDDNHININCVNDLHDDAIGLLIRIGDCRFGPRTRVHHNSLSLLVRLVDDVGSPRLGVLKVDLRLSPHRSLVGLISWHTRW